MDSPYALHLAIAALVGASFAAASAYYMHRKTLDQLLRFARDQQRRRNRLLPEGDELEDGEEDPPPHWDHDRRTLPIPPGLPPLHTGREGCRPVVSPGSTKRVGPIVRPTTPKSSVPTISAFDRIEDSDDEEDLVPDAKNDTAYLTPNGAIGSDLTDKASQNGELTSAPSTQMIRSHSATGSLHVPQLNPIAADILRKEPEHETFSKINITAVETPSPDEIEAYKVLQKCLELRQRYIFREEVAPWEKEIITDPSTPKPNPNPFSYEHQAKTDHHFEMVDGVIHVYPNKDSKERLYPVADATTFFTDMHYVLRVLAAGDIRTVCHHRLNLLEQKFNLHLMVNTDRELLAQKAAPHRDFYNVRKVDTHVHHSACMNQKHLLRFIKSKLRKEPDEVVIFRDGTYLTLKEVFESLDLTGYDLNVDLLDVHADKSTFHRFDKFNLKYNPCGQSRLREIFLKQDNLIQGANILCRCLSVSIVQLLFTCSIYLMVNVNLTGRFLAELTKEVFSDLEASKYQMAEYRISIYGRKKSEWDQMASWIVNNELYSENVVWLIQIPRIYNVYREMGTINSFQNLLDNIFLPLYEVTVDPASHPQLHVFLKQVVGLDLVDDESKPERRPTKHMPTPEQWTNIFNPAYAYYVYYCYANLYTLNKLRESKGMTTIKLRPHCGEAGDIDHLAAAFLTSHNIAHGVNLKKSPVLQYLYYLAQIGLAMSPLSNNSLFIDYHRNPFPTFFLRGLNVSLSTDDPLQIHLTKEPLVEEYSVAASLWKLSSCDLCEIARNSVYQSGFSHRLKSHWIGRNYYRRGPEGNDIHQTNVPHIRVEFRHTIWKEEMELIHFGNVNLPEEVDR
ncbi:AMP deaminase [Zea mays]|uniref:AMP deaminase n=2 Tax=Zea mays TaxID=4577 RepID=A0A1D6IP63_MAIZE|nr:AMP deaminase [Zea mays]